MVMIYRFVPYLPLKSGDNAFRRPPFWYRRVGKSLNAFGWDYYLFPFNLLAKFVRYYYVKKQEKAFKRK